MLTFRRFFDLVTPEPAAAAIEPPSLASIMAKSGALNSSGREGVIPSINTEKQESTTPATQTSPALATESVPAAEAKPSSLSPKQEPVVAAPQTAEPAKVPSWQEVLNSQQPDAILKELGYDEKVVKLINRLKDKPEMTGFLDHWESKGDVKQYLSALNTDYQKMSPEDVMKHQLQAQNPELDAKQLDTLFKIKVTNRYKLDDQLYTEDEVAEGRIELLADAKPIRNALAEEQKKFLLPTPPEPKAAGPDPQVERQKNYDAFKTALTNDSYIKDVLANKKITIGEGPEAFSYPVDPDSLMKVMLDDDTWASKLLKVEDRPDGTKIWSPNGRKQALIGAILNDDEGFLKSMANHYKSFGGKSAIEPIENAKPPVGVGTPAKAEVTSTNPAAAAARGGRLVRGGE